MKYILAAGLALALSAPQVMALSKNGNESLVAAGNDRLGHSLPSATKLANGKVLACWSETATEVSEGGSTSYAFRVKAKVLNADGSPAGPALEVGDVPGPLVQRFVQCKATPDGGAWIAYYAQRYEPGSSVMPVSGRLKKMDAAGNLSAGVIFGDGDQLAAILLPSIAVAPNGDAWVSYSHTYVLPNQQYQSTVMLERYDSAGNRVVSNAFRTATGSAPTEVYYTTSTAISPAGNHLAVSVYKLAITATNGTVASQEVHRFDGSGTQVGAPFTLSGAQALPLLINTMALTNSGVLSAVWEEADPQQTCYLDNGESINCFYKTKTYLTQRGADNGILIAKKDLSNSDAADNLVPQIAVDDAGNLLTSFTAGYRNARQEIVGIDMTYKLLSPSGDQIGRTYHYESSTANAMYLGTGVSVANGQWLALGSSSQGDVALERADLFAQPLKSADSGVLPQVRRIVQRLLSGARGVRGRLFGEDGVLRNLRDRVFGP